MMPAWRAAALTYRAARGEGRSHHRAQDAARMAIQAHHPALSRDEASDESIKAIAYASSFHAEWFWRPLTVWMEQQKRPVDDVDTPAHLPR